MTMRKYDRLVFCLVLCLLGSLVWGPRITNLQAGNSGYYFAYTGSTRRDGHTVLADRVSNIYYSDLAFAPMQNRLRAILGGYKGELGYMGAYPNRQNAQAEIDRHYKGLPTFSVPDPLR